MAENWIIPCNIKHFDLIKHFRSSNRVVWRNSFTIRKGDVAYIYLSAPYSEIRYRCNVIDDNVSDELLNANTYAIPQKISNNFFSKKIKYIVMELEFEYPNGLITLNMLRDHGLGQVQIQARADKQVREFIQHVTEKYEEERGK